MLEILIDGYNVDYGDAKDLRLAFTYSIADINQINDRSTQGSRSYEITLPATNNNRKIFGFVEDSNSYNGFNQSVSKECQVYVDGSLVIDGTARIKAVVKNDGIDDYKIVILGDTATWINDIKDLSLNELDFSSENHTFNVTNIRAAQTLSDSRSYVYPFINYGQFEGEPNTFDYGNWLNSTDYKLPAFKIKSILEKIFSTQGYTIKSDFLDTDYVKALIMPYTAKNFDEILDESFRDDRLFRVKPNNNVISISNTSTRYYINFQDETSTGYFDTGNLYDYANGGYVVDTPSIQEFVFNFEPTFQTEYRVQFGIERLKTDGTKDILVARQYDNGDGQLTPDNVKTGFVALNTGDVIRAYVINFYNRTGGALGTEIPVTLTPSNTYFYNNVQLSNAPNSTLNLNQYLPDRSQLDFVKGVRDLFNLNILTDLKKKIVYIEPRDTFFNSTALDWTDKVDLSKPIETTFLGSNLNKEIRVKYVDDSNDDNLETYLKENERSYGSVDIDINNVNARTGLGVKSNSFFAPTFMKECPAIGLTGMKVPTLIDDLDEPDYSTAFEPRVLHYNPQDYAFNSVVLYTIFKGDFLDTTTLNDYSLAYSDDVNTNGLYQRYFRNIYNTINQSRIDKYSMYLKPIDIENLDFRTPIVLQINGEPTYYHLNKIISYNPLGNGLTKVELLKIVNPIPIATITEFTGTLPPDSTPTPATALKANINGVTANVKVNLNGTTKEVYYN